MLGVCLNSLTCKWRERGRGAALEMKKLQRTKKINLWEYVQASCLCNCLVNLSINLRKDMKEISNPYSDNVVDKLDKFKFYFMNFSLFYDWLKLLFFSWGRRREKPGREITPVFDFTILLHQHVLNEVMKSHKDDKIPFPGTSTSSGWKRLQV